MHLIDVHCHLDFKEFAADLNETLERAHAAGIRHIIINGTDAASNTRILELAKKHSIIKAALGIYPTNIISITAQEFETELSRIEREAPIAIGEVGLDYKETTAEHEQHLMRERFRAFIALAQRLNIPLIIHSRKAEEDCIAMLEEAKARKVVMHCFSGKKRLIQRIIDNGWSLSIPTSIVRAEHFQSIVATQPLSRLLTETDAPFLSPHREARNEPAFIVETIKKIAELKGQTPEEVADQIYMNYQRLFL
ncbi:MAG: TatD family hydrolase [Nitrosarchaeum sp.]|nr:TatD family hydrolase [Nitrosarchaeum sp.]